MNLVCCMHCIHLENREYGRRNPSRWPRGTLYPQNLALTSPTSGCRSVSIVRSLTQATEFSLACTAWVHGRSLEHNTSPNRLYLAIVMAIHLNTEEWMFKWVVNLFGDYLCEQLKRYWHFKGRLMENQMWDFMFLERGKEDYYFLEWGRV
jgi:hypothetical protein